MLFLCFFSSLIHLSTVPDFFENPLIVPLFDPFRGRVAEISLPIMQPPPNRLPDSTLAAHFPSFFTPPSKTDSFQSRELLKTLPESSHNGRHGRSSKDEAPSSFPHNKPSHPYIGPSIPTLPSSNSSQSELFQPLLAQELFVHNKGRKIMTASDRIMKAIEGVLVPWRLA